MRNRRITWTQRASVGESAKGSLAQTTIIILSRHLHENQANSWFLGSQMIANCHQFLGDAVSGNFALHGSNEKLNFCLAISSIHAYSASSLVLPLFGILTFIGISSCRRGCVQGTKFRFSVFVYHQKPDMG